MLSPSRVYVTLVRVNPVHSSSDKEASVDAAVSLARQLARVGARYPLMALLAGECVCYCCCCYLQCAVADGLEQLCHVTGVVSDEAESSCQPSSSSSSSNSSRSAALEGARQALSGAGIASVVVPALNNCWLPPFAR